MKSDQNRNESYDAKVAPTTVALKVAAQLPTMRAGFLAETETLVAHQLATAQVLDTVGIVGLQRGRYQAFSNRLHAITRRFTGLTAINMAQLEHDRWESSNQSAVMITIALTVYGMILT